MHAGGLKPQAAMRTELIAYKSLVSEIENTIQNKKNKCCSMGSVTDTCGSFVFKEQNCDKKLRLH